MEKVVIRVSCVCTNRNGSTETHHFNGASEARRFLATAVVANKDYVSGKVKLGDAILAEASVTV